MGKKKNKEEVKKRIYDFFKNIEEKNAKEIRKIKRLAMHYNIRLKELRKKFCKKCYNPYVPGKTCKIRIKKGMKIVECLNCGYIARWKIK